MSLSLTVADNTDGTGGVATITGSDTASTNTVYRSAWPSLTYYFPWLSTATRTGDGTIAVTPGTGIGTFFWYAAGMVSAAPALSSVIQQPLTDQTTSVHNRCLLAYQQQIQNLPLSGLAASNVQIAWLPDAKFLEALVSWPAVFVTPLDSEGQPGMLNSEDDIEYPVLVSIVDLFGGPQAAIARRLLWRQQIFRWFRHQRLLGVPEIITTDVVPRPIVDPAWYTGASGNQLWYSALLFKPRSREKRGG